MAKAMSRHDFLVQDLVVTVGAGGRGGTWMPAEDTVTPPSPISPIASVVAHLDLIEAVRGTIRDAVKAGRLEEVARAFAFGERGGDAVIQTAIQEIGAAVVASAAFAELAGGDIGMPNPECDGTSYETIPTTLSPVIHTGLTVHKTTELPRLRRQLQEAVGYIEQSAAALEPRGAEIGLVREHLEGALKSLPR